MIHKMATPDANYVRVSFELPSCLWADRIYLVGDFNGWDQTAMPMRQERDGVWRAVIDLPRDRSFEFRYLVDGQWTSDFHADGFTQNRYGDSNSIVHTALPVTTIPKHTRSEHEERVGEVVTLPVVTAQRTRQSKRLVYPARKALLAG